MLALMNGWKLYASWLLAAALGLGVGLLARNPPTTAPLPSVAQAAQEEAEGRETFGSAQLLLGSALTRAEDRPGSVTAAELREAYERALALAEQPHERYWVGATESRYQDALTHAP